jgi:type I restriction enzyme, S subunit
MTAWKTVTLGDVAEFVRGINFKPDDIVQVGAPGSVACMRTKNVQAKLDCSDVWGIDKRFVKREEQYLATGDILVSSANSWNLVGKCCWVPDLPWRATFGGFVSVLRPRRTKVDPGFLFRWFSSDRIQTTLRSFGQQTTNISNLNTDRCRKLPFPLPPLAEQRRIAEVLDRAEALRAKRRAALPQLDILTQAVFFDLFGDPSTNPKGLKIEALGDHLSFVTSGSRGWAEFYASTGVRFIRSLDVQMNYIGDEDMTFVVPPDNAEARRTRVSVGDVLLTITGSRIGRVAPVNNDLDGAHISQHVAILRADPNRLDPKFMSFFLSLEIGGQRQIAKAQYGQTKPGLNFEQIRHFQLPVPPIQLQREFAHRVAAVEKLKTSHRASLNEIETLFASLQYRAFRGEL